MNTQRTDSYRPSVIKPEEYEFVAFDYQGGSDLGAIMALHTQREIFRAHMNQTGGKYAKHHSSGSCHVCGAHAVYLCIWYSAKENHYIWTGEDCAQKMDMSYGDISAFRRAFADAREAKAGKAKAQAILSDLNLSQAWVVYTATYQHAADCALRFDSETSARCTCGFKFYYEESTIIDIIGKLVKYGSISDGQIKFVRTLLEKIDNRPAIEAQKAAERELAADCPTGRITISGVVLAVKVVETPFGDQTRILVKADSGFKVWGSRFSVTGMDGGVQKDQAVKFVATVTPSTTDSKFGYFKRPVVALPELSKDDKKAIKLLKRASKHLGYNTEVYSAVTLLDLLAQTIKNPFDEYTKQRISRWQA